MAVLVNAGRAALASAMIARPLYLAWGTGSAAWDTALPSPSASATALTAELGRVVASTKAYVVADSNGAIDVPNGKFALSATPTNNVYLAFNFGFTDATGQTIRETGLFMDTVLVGGLPGGQTYFVPANLSAPGTLIALEYFYGIVRSSLVRQRFEFVLTL